MMRIVDYTFYRVYAFYRKNKDTTPVVMGVLVLSVVISFTILAANTILNIISKNGAFINKWVLLAVLMVCLILLGKRFKKAERIASLEKKYMHESPNRRLYKGLLIILYFLATFLSPVVYGFLKHNLHMDI